MSCGKSSRKSKNTQAWLFVCLSLTNNNAQARCTIHAAESHSRCIVAVVVTVTVVVGSVVIAEQQSVRKEH
jgi:hypothetical protein